MLCLFQKPPPQEMLTSVPIPSTASINFHPVECFTTDSIKQHPKLDLKQIPVQMQLDSVHTSFVYVRFASSVIFSKTLCPAICIKDKDRYSTFQTNSNDDSTYVNNLIMN